MVVAGDERQRRRGVGARHIGFDQRRSDALDEERRCGGVAVVDFVAHVERLRHQRFEFDRAAAHQRGRQRWRDNVGHRAQARDDLGPVRAEAQHLAQAFVEVAVRAPTGGAVLDHEQRHRRADDAGHRPHRRLVVARFEIDFPACDEAFRSFH